MSYKPIPTKNVFSPTKNAINKSDMPYEIEERRMAKPFKFWRGIYNKDKNYYLGRSPRNWG